MKRNSKDRGETEGKDGHVLKSLFKHMLLVNHAEMSVDNC